MNKIQVMFGTLLMLSAVSGHAKVNVFACEPEWAALATIIGQTRVSAKSAVHALQDPHHIEARPSLIARMRRADLLVCTGAGLEAGWLPVLLRRSANAKIQPGKPGHFMATDFVKLLEKSHAVDRSLGDVHADGNPHIHTNPQNLLLVAKQLANRLAEIDSANAQAYRNNYQAFASRWKQAMQRWQGSITSLQGKKIVSQHKTWSYLIHWAKLDLVTTIEEKPGVPPSFKRLGEVLAKTRQGKVKLIIHADYIDPKPSKWLASQSGIRRVALPYTVKKNTTESLIGWFDEIISKLRAE